MSTRPGHSPRPAGRRLGLEPLEERAIPAHGTIGTAIPVAPVPGSPVQVGGVITDADGVDIYAITIRAGQSFSVRVTAQALGGLDGVLRLFNGSGTELGFSQDYSGNDPALLVQFRPPGTYFVGLSATGNPEYDAVTGRVTPNLSRGPFEMTFAIDDERPDAANDTLAGAVPVDIPEGSGSDIPGRISSPTDVDLFAVMLRRGQGLTATAGQADSQFDGYLRLFDARGRQLTANDDFDGRDAAIGFVAPTDGVYFVGVSPFPNSAYDPVAGGGGRAADRGGDYVLRLSVADGSPDGNDTLDTATPVPVALGRTVDLRASILGRSDVDVYAVELSAGDVLAVGATADNRNNLDGYLRLFDTDGNEVGYNDDASATDPGQRLYAPADGVYYVAVSGYPEQDYDPNAAGTGDSDSFGPYAFRLTRTRYAPDGNDSLNEAPVLSWRGDAEQTTSGAIDHTRDADLFALDLPAGATVSLAVDARLYGSPLDSFLRMFDAAGRELAADDDRNAGTRDYGLDFVAPIAGRYFVGVSSYADGDDYDPVDPLGGDRQPDSVGFNNLRYVVIPPAPPRALPLAPGGAAAGSGPTVYDIVLDQPGRLTARLTMGDGAAPRLTLSGPDGALLTSAGTAANTAAAEVTLHLPRGRYQLAVAGATGFRLETQFDPASDPLDEARDGLYPFASAAGDFDRDGRLDLVTANYDSSTVSVLPGLGDGTFRPRTDLPAGASPTAVATADLDGDGFLDLAVAARDVRIFYGRGDGTFAVQVDLGVRSPSDLAVADLNRDGRPDLVVSVPGAVVGVLNRGHRAFGVGTPVVVGGAPQSIAVADLNGDGTPDVAVAQAGEGFLPGTVVTFLGSGTGSFAQGVRLGTGREPEAVRAADFDGDGLTDLAVVHFGSDDVWVFRGTGGGTFTHTATLAVGRGPVGLEVGDVNSDGTRDLITVDSNTNSVSVLLGVGDGTFRPARRAGRSSFPVSVALGDFDGDGRTDLAIGDAPSTTSTSEIGDGNDRVAVLLGRGDGTFRDGSPPVTGAAPIGVAAGDLNQDGFADAVAANQNDDTVSVLLSNGDGTFRAQDRIPVGAAPQGVAVADLNGDGRPDIAVTAEDDDAVVVLLGVGDGTFVRGARFVLPGGAERLAVADFDGDGKPDLAVVGPRGLTVLTGDGTGGFTPGSPLPVGGGKVWVAAADFDGDGDFDLATVSQTAGDVRLLTNDGRGRFTRTSQLLLGAGTRGTAAGRFNADRRADLAVVNENLNTLTVLVGGPTGFSVSAVVPVGDMPQEVAVADFDGDNRLDVAVTDFDTRTGEYVSVFSGNGDGTFGPAVEYGRGNLGLTGVAVADVDGNGTPDLVTADLGSDTALVFLNGGTRLVPVGDGFVNEFQAVPAVTDLDGDGAPDLVSVSRSGDILLRRGSPGRPGVFESPLPINAGFPVRNAVGVTGTNLLAAVPTRQGHEVYLFRTDRPGAEPTRLIAGDIPARLAVADLDGDGRPDLVVAGVAGGVTVFRGRAGGFDPDPAAVIATDGVGPAAVAVADIDGRPGPDVLVLSQVSGTVTLLPNLGDFRLGPGVPYRGTTGTSGVAADGRLAVRSPDRPSALAVGALTAGGPTGVVVLASDADRFALLGTEGGGLTNPVSMPGGTTGRKPVALATSDLNGDGRLDLLTLNKDDRTLSVFLGRTGGFAEAAGRRTAVGPGTVGLTVADLSGPNGVPDGVADVLIGNDFGDVLLVVGNGDGTFRPFVRTDQRVPFAVTDVDGDGVPDIVLADQGHDLASARARRPGTGSFTPGAFQQDGSNGLIGPGAVAAADLNGDGLADLVFANTGSNTVLVYLRRADGSFADDPAVFFAGTSPTALDVVQLNDDNGDGRIDARDLPDLVVANQGSNDASVLFGSRDRDANGDGVIDDRDLFRPGPRLLSGGAGLNAVSTVDVTGDGIPDLLMTNGQTGTLTVIPGIGSGGLGTGFFNDGGTRTLPIAPGPVRQTQILGPTLGLALGADRTLWEFDPQSGASRQMVAPTGPGAGIVAFEAFGTGRNLQLVLGLADGSVVLTGSDLSVLRTVASGLTEVSDLAVVPNGAGLEVYLTGLVGGEVTAVAVSLLFDLLPQAGDPVVVTPLLTTELQAVDDSFALVATLLTGFTGVPPEGTANALDVVRFFDPFSAGLAGVALVPIDDIFVDDTDTIQTIGSQLLAEIETGSGPIGVEDSAEAVPEPDAHEADATAGRLRRWVDPDGALGRLIHPEDGLRMEPARGDGRDELRFPPDAVEPAQKPAPEGDEPTGEPGTGVGPSESVSTGPPAARDECGGIFPGAAVPTGRVGEPSLVEEGYSWRSCLWLVAALACGYQTVSLRLTSGKKNRHGAAGGGSGNSRTRPRPPG